MTSPTIAKILLVGLGVSGAALPGKTLGAQVVAVATEPAPSPIKNDTGKRICRIVTPTGSRFTQRVCRTPDEWAKAARQGDDLMQRLQDGGRSPPCGGKLDCN